MYGLANSKRELDDIAWQNIYQINAKRPRVAKALFIQADESGDHEQRVASNSIGNAETKTIVEEWNDFVGIGFPF